MTEHYKTLDSCVSLWAQKTPHQEAAGSGSIRLDYAELEELIGSCAVLLQQHNIGAGDRVAVMASPGISYLVTLMAIARAGGIYVGINPRYVESEIAHIVNMTEPRLLLVETSFEDPGRVDRMNTAIAGTMISREVSSCVIAIHGLSDLTGSAGKILCSKSCQADIAVIVFTSGSTGKPKGAALHHGGLLAAALEQSSHVDGEPRRYLSNLPVNHVGGVMNLTLGCLVAGGTLIFQPKFDASKALELIASERISSWLQVPAMFTLATLHSDFANANLASVRSICIGGGAVSAPTLAALRTIGARIFVEYRAN